MPDSTRNAGLITNDAKRRDRLIRQVIRARRSVDAALRSQSKTTGDPAKLALVERAPQRAHDPPHDALPGGAT